MGNEIFYDLTRPGSGLNSRFVQPHQIAYFVTTVDAAGNVNTTPVTLGTCVSVDMEPDSSGNFFFVFALGRSDLEEPPIEARHGFLNLEEIPECVISWIGAHLFLESEVACLPLPRGISELETAGLTALESQKVRPPGIQECLVNIECEVVSSTPIGSYYQLYVVRAVGVTVDADLVELDASSRLHAGAMALDPLFEVRILAENDRPPRLYYIKLDPRKLLRMTDRFGPQREWIGSYEDWLDDEVGQGRLSSDERAELLDLNQRWQANRDPIGNTGVKRELTRRLAELVKVQPVAPLKRDLVGWDGDATL